jgi:methylated-DNA-protein-cysteine methyltransferase-like protein
MSPFTTEVIEIIKAIPQGQVATYGQVAALAGHPRAPRQVAGILKRYSKQFDLPWHRVISSKGVISITEPIGRLEQAHRLRDEGVEVSIDGSIDLSTFGWKVERFDV